MFREEGAPLFDSRSAQMGHTLQGGIPTPRDRGRAVRLAVRSVQFLEQRAAGVEATDLEGHDPPRADTDVGILVIESSRVRVANLSEMAEAADGKHRRAKEPWWLKMREVQVN
jgi:6-phosphofructokinase 1